MIRKMMLVSLLLAGGASWAVAQDGEAADSACAVSDMTQRMTVSQLFDMMEAGSKSLRAQKTSVEAARLGVDMAKSKRLPDLDVSLSLSYIGNALITDRDFSNVHGLRSPHLGNDFSFQAQQVLYAGGAIDAGVKMAEIGKEKAETGVKMVRQQVRFAALAQYLNLCKIDNRIKVYEKNIALTERLLADIREKNLQGMALKNDMTRYELQMESLKLGLTALRNSRSILNHQLCNIIGLEPGVTVVPDASVADAVYGKDGEQHWQQAGLLSAPRLQQSALDVRMAEQQEKLAKSDMLPKVALVAANNFNGPILFELPPVDKNLNVWYVGVGVKYSLSALYKSNKRVRQAAVETAHMREMRDVEAEKLNDDVQEAYVQYMQTYVELDTQRKSVELARQNYDVMSARYMSQLALVTDMVDASNLRLNAELQEVDARINIAYAYYRMMFVAGEI